MKKQILSLVAMMALIQNITVNAREMRAPIPFRNGFQRFEHYPYICEDLDKCWDYDIWGGAFHRQAGDAFTHGTKKESLAGLYFGADSFRGIQIFPAGTPNGGVAALTFAELTPIFNYSENSAMFGFNVNRRFDCGKWDVGIRTNIPFRSVAVTLENCCDLEEGIADVVVSNVRGINNGAPEWVVNNNDTLSTVVQSYAYRLDFLASLYKVMNPTPAELADGSQDLVDFRRPFGADFHVTINDQVVDEANNSPIHVVRSTESAGPELPYSKRLFVGANQADNPFMAPGTQDQGVQNLPPLPADGSIATNGNRARFDSDVNYADGATALKNNVPNQRLLWVVPTDDGNPFEISAPADNIRGKVTPFLQNAVAQAAQQESTVDFLRSRGVTFDTQRLTGAGDLDVDFYARRNWYDLCHGDVYVEGITGIRFPTGKKVKNPGNLLAQPLGNNGHFEIKLGGQVGYQPCDWFAMKADVQFYHVFKRTEKVAAAFTGATIRNINPTVDAKVSWNYFLGNLDFTFVVPCTDNCVGFDLGYQPYYKFKDKIHFEQLTAVDFLGNVQTLDAALLERNTNRLAQRVKTEIFHKNCTWEIYGGWLHTFAGKNIQRETDWYLGFGLFF